MMSLKSVLTVVAYVISFGVTFFLMPVWIRYAQKSGLVGRDMHKKGKVMIPEAGGLVVVAAIVVSLLYLAGIHAFVDCSRQHITLLIGAVSSILCVAIIGIMDDFGGWKKGLKQWQKPLLTIPAAIPFFLANYDKTIIDIPFVGIRDVGVLSPLGCIPIAIVIGSNAFNMLAGYNGLEAGMGIIMLSTICVLSLLFGESFAVVLCIIGIIALATFLIYNWYPSKVFPGDTMTYPIGAYIAICAILSNHEKFALILFIPYYLDFLLPLRKKLKVEAFATVNGDGSLSLPYERIYDTTHLAILLLSKVKKKVYEMNVVYAMLGFELLLAILCIVLFFIPRFF